MNAPSDFNPEIRSTCENAASWYESGDSLREYLKNGMEPDEDGMVQVRNETEMNAIIDEVYANGTSSRPAYNGDTELGLWMIETVDGGEPGWSDDPATW